MNPYRVIYKGNLHSHTRHSSDDLHRQICLVRLVILNYGASGTFFSAAVRRCLRLAVRRRITHHTGTFLPGVRMKRSILVAAASPRPVAASRHGQSFHIGGAGRAATVSGESEQHTARRAADLS
jgi:hypothetical protein